MALQKKGKYWYGADAQDIKASIVTYSQRNGYTATRFAQPVCACVGGLFHLDTDEDAGVGQRTCVGCGAMHFMGDSAEYASEAQVERHECICAAQTFELLSGVALYEGSNDVRWYYIGCRCAGCNLVGVFAHWKCEAGDASAFLAQT